MRKKGNRKRKRRTFGIICLVAAGMMAGAGLFGAVRSNAAEEKAVANKTWESVERTIKTKVGEGYEEVGLCTGFLYWCLKNAYGVDWGSNSKVWQLENKLKAAGITKVAEGSDGKITSAMKPGDIIIFIDGSQRSHCAVLGEGGKLYHAVRGGVKDSHTLSGWMKMPYSEKGCDKYVVYRGLISSGNLIVTKKSSHPELTDENGCYSLAGAEYGLYQGDRLYGVLTTDANGRGVLADIPYGEYVLKELAPSKGYSLDKSRYKVKIDRRSVSLTVEEVPQGDEVDALLYKIDGEIHIEWSEDNRGQAAAELAGAVYSVRYYDGYYDSGAAFEEISHVRSWVIGTDESGLAVLNEENLISGDPLYYSSAGNVILPLGTVVINEMKAPEGYLLDDTEHIVQITASGTEEIVDTYIPPTHSEQIIRGDIDLIKTEDGTMKRLGGVPFTITSKTTGEAHTIVTDVNGYAESSGVWFGNIEAVSDERGALPYDTYIVDEQACEANEGLELIKGVEIKIYRDGRTVSLGTVTNDRKPEITVKTVEPEEPGTPEKPASVSAKQGEAKTGDEFPVWVTALFNLMVVSAAAACVTAIRRRS